MIMCSLAHLTSPVLFYSVFFSRMNNFVSGIAYDRGKTKALILFDEDERLALKTEVNDLARISITATTKYTGRYDSVRKY